MRRRALLSWACTRVRRRAGDARDRGDAHRCDAAGVCRSGRSRGARKCADARTIRALTFLVVGARHRRRVDRRGAERRLAASSSSSASRSRAITRPAARRALHGKLRHAAGARPDAGAAAPSSRPAGWLRRRPDPVAARRPPRRRRSARRRCSTSTGASLHPIAADAQPARRRRGLRRWCRCCARTGRRRALRAGRARHRRPRAAPRLPASRAPARRQGRLRCGGALARAPRRRLARRRRPRRPLASTGGRERGRRVVRPDRPLAGVEPIGLVPKRRAAFVFAPPPGVSVRWLAGVRRRRRELVRQARRRHASRLAGQCRSGRAARRPPGGARHRPGDRPDRRR